jgi:hypothetical protein
MVFVSRPGKVTYARTLLLALYNVGGVFAEH